MTTTSDNRIDLDDIDSVREPESPALAADIDIKKQIFAPPAPDEFAGQLTIGTKWKDTENIKNLVAAFKDPDGNALQLYEPPNA